MYIMKRSGDLKSKIIQNVFRYIHEINKMDGIRWFVLQPPEQDWVEWYHLKGDVLLLILCLGT